MLNFPRVPIFLPIYYRKDRERNGEFTEMCEVSISMKSGSFFFFRNNIAASSLKISCTNLYSLKSYDETNIEVFALSLWEKMSWDLTYFDEFLFFLGCIF